MEADNLQVHMALLERGAGVGFLPELLAAPALNEGRLVRMLPNWFADPLSFHVVTPSARRHGAAVTRFVDELVDHFRETCERELLSTVLPPRPWENQLTRCSLVG
ncbi:MAG: hypothetical protein KC561_13860 [Myxococcales bacterium]|nr:hypothetical protein [Myxococcales bacterium]